MMHIPISCFINKQNFYYNMRLH